MEGKHHIYSVQVKWIGNLGRGTTTYTSYQRDHTISSGMKPPISGSSDPAFRGDAARWNPEDLLLASISSCHQLWYLHLCSAAGISVISYKDDAEGTMQEDPDGKGRFISAVLRPQVVIRPGDDVEQAMQLHHDAHRYCFIANSVNFPIACEPRVTQDSTT